MHKTKLLAYICYQLRFHKVAYFLNRNRKRIITFHNILSDDVFVENVANGVSNSLSQFKIIIKEVEKYFDFSLDLYDAKTATITFDDGYRNQYDVAAKYLIEKNIPAYLFVSGQLIKNDEDKKQIPLTIDLLLHWVSYVPDGDYEISFNEKKYHLEINNDNRNLIWQKFIWPMFLEDYTSKGFNLLQALSCAYNIDVILSSLPKSYKIQRLDGITQAQIEDLKSKGWQVGWHTHSHYPLKFLDKAEKSYELKPQAEGLSTVLSYPYGNTNEVDRESIEIAKSLGYTSAVSNTLEDNELSGSWFLPRMSLSSDVQMLHFELSGLKHLIKYRRLLPKVK